MIKAKFVGWLADLLGHKEITQWKGTGGNMCCPECANIHKDARGDDDRRGYGPDCSNMQNFDRLSSDDIYGICDELAEQYLVLGVPAFEALETKKGFTYVPNGLLFDPSLRLIHRPHQHTIRDWQHTLAQDGVINPVNAVVVQAVIGT